MIQDRIEKAFTTLVPDGVRVSVIRNIMHQRWEIYCTSKNEYPRKSNGEWCFFAIGYSFKNKYYIENNLFELVKILYGNWLKFLDTVDIDKPRIRNFNKREE